MPDLTALQQLVDLVEATVRIGLLLVTITLAHRILHWFDVRIQLDTIRALVAEHTSIATARQAKSPPPIPPRKV